MNLFALLPIIFEVLKHKDRIAEAFATGRDVLGIIGLLPLPPEAVEQAFDMFDPNQVRWVQGRLNTLGMAAPPLVVDGNYGKRTKAAVMAFQQQHGQLEADGWAGRLTTTALQSAM